jgi:hypothetical protein
LPQYPNETDTDYEIRRLNAPLTNIYADVSQNLSDKPFAEKCELEEGTAEDLVRLTEDIDGQGNNMHVFVSETFKNGIDKGIDWILVEFTKVPPGATLADERNMGARPYWLHIPCERLLAVYSAFFNGKEILTHARIYEPVTRRNGYGEECVQRVRVLNREEIVDGDDKVIGYAPATFELYELQEDQATKQMVWNVVDTGQISIGIIPLVPFMTGKRKGASWQVEPPLRDLAYMQIEEFQQESNLKTVKELTAFPMLTGDGVPQPVDAAGEAILVPVGPKAVLFAPPNNAGQHGSWKYIEPQASSLTFLQADLEKFRNEMRHIGKQPMATANLTVVTTANVAMKANSAVQAWALYLKDALEQAWVITCMWLQKPDAEVGVFVYTDFGIDIQAGKELDILDKGRARGDLTLETYWGELKRRKVLSADFDPEEEHERMAEEQEGLEPEQPIDPATGMPIMPQPGQPPAVDDDAPPTIN